MKVGCLSSTAALAFAWGISLMPVLGGQPQSIPAVDIGVMSTTAPAVLLPEFSSAGLPVLWEVLTGPAAVSGHTVTPTGVAGAVTLRGRQTGDATYDPAPDLYATFLVDAGGGYQTLSAGETFVVSIKSDGSLWAWGNNTDGQLGDGTTTGHAAPAPVTVPTADPWTEVACGRAHAVALRADGSLWSWGANDDGQLGLGNNVARTFPTRIGTLDTWAGVACGSNHTIAWRTDGTLWTWGDNLQGQLGDTTIADRNAPVRVGTASDWVEAAGGSAHTIARRAGGSIWTWGLNSSGQLGDGTTTRRLAPVRVGTDSNWAGVSAGYIFSAGRRTNGTLCAWGHNASGQLGQGNRTFSTTALQVGTDTDWAGVHCGAACVIGTRTSGQLWAWGDNSAGQLGDGTTSDQLIPVATLAGPWTSLTVGAACALGVNGGTIWSWGTNDYEQLGLPAGSTTTTFVPPGARLPLPVSQSAIAQPAVVGLNQILAPVITSFLPPDVSVISGPAVVTGDGHGLSFTGGGTVEFQVSHPGDSAWSPVAVQTFTISVDATAPVFTTAPGNQFVQMDSPAGTVVNFTAAANDAVTGPAAVVCVPASGSVFPGGVSTVTCTADDGFGNVATHTFTVTVNRRPEAASFTVTAIAPAIPFTLSATDADGDATTLSILSSPANGTLTGTMPNFTWAPDPGFLGSTTLTYKANDGSIDSLPATVTLTAALNGEPTVSDLGVTTGEDVPLPLTLTGNDVDGQPLTFAIVTPPTRGTITGTSPNFTYTPDENTFGPDSFTFKASDGQLDSNTATVSITVTPVNDAPVTWFDVFSINEDTVLTVTASRTILLNDSDLHGGAAAENNNPLTATLADAPAHAASFTFNPNGTFTYQPRPDFYGFDSFTYLAVDALGAVSEPETVLIAVRAVNDAPVGAAQSVTTLEDVPRSIHLQSTDADVTFASSVNPGPAPHDSDPSYTIVTPPQHGTLTGAAPHLIYTPAADYHGTDSFTFTVSDGLASSAPATVSITVEADNDGDELPDGWEMAYFGNLNSSSSDDPDLDGQSNAFELLAGNSPADGGESLTVELASTPQEGVLRLNLVQPGVVYVLESSHDLTTWDRLSENTYEATGPGALYDERTNLSEQRRCFYRVTIEPAP